MKLLFRKARLEDVDVLFTLLNSSYRGDSAKKGWTYESDLVGGLRITHEELFDIISKNNEFFLLALSEDKVVGCVQITEEADELYFGLIAVEPALQNKSIGSKILAEIDLLARIKKKSHIRLVVIHTRDELIAYYERKGFRHTGESSEFPAEYPAKIPGLRLLEMKKTL